MKPVGDLTFPLIEEYVDDIVVEEEEEEIVAALEGLGHSVREYV